MKKGGAILMTNTKEFMFNEKFYLTETLPGFHKVQVREDNFFLIERRCKWKNVILIPSFAKVNHEKVKARHAVTII